MRGTEKAFVGSLRVEMIALRRCFRSGTYPKTLSSAGGSRGRSPSIREYMAFDSEF